MGTRSDIIVKRTNGTFARVYCHWDGYPDHNGKLLQEHYSSQKLAEALVAPGDMSSLAEKCTKPLGHSFDKPVKGYSVYYGRDRGESDTETKVFDSLAAAWPDNETGTEFTYVWQNDSWWIGDPDTGTQTLKPLADVLAGKTEILSNVKAFGGNFVIGTRTPKAGSRT